MRAITYFLPRPPAANFARSLIKGETHVRVHLFSNYFFTMKMTFNNQHVVYFLLALYLKIMKIVFVF